jgi:hypothetical protein
MLSINPVDNMKGSMLQTMDNDEVVERKMKLITISKARQALVA